MDIGARLHAVRNRHGLSQRELAKRVGVTNSTISLIEQNKVSPSISSLKKVLDGIPISLAEFFTLDAPPASSDSPFYKPDEMPDLGDNTIRYFLVGQRHNHRQMCVMREEMPPGSDTGESMISHQGEEGGVIVQGRVEITIGVHVKVLEPGEAYYFDSSIPHRFRSVGDETAIIVSASTPPTF